MKLSYEQRQKIRAQILEEKEQQEKADEAEQEEAKLTRKQIKAIYAEEPNDDLSTNKDLKKQNRTAKRSFKRQEREKKKVAITWNIKVGDAVLFKRAGEEAYGMVIEQKANGEYRNTREAKYRGYVLVMSSAGRHWMNPSELSVIED